MTVAGEVDPVRDLDIINEELRWLKHSKQEFFFCVGSVPGSGLDYYIRTRSNSTGLFMVAAGADPQKNGFRKDCQMFLKALGGGGVARIRIFCERC